MVAINAETIKRRQYNIFNQWGGVTPLFVSLTLRVLEGKQEERICSENSVRGYGQSL